MSTAIPSPLRREPQLAGQTVVVIGGSAGIGLETARLAHAEGATLVLTARNPERLQHVAREALALVRWAFLGCIQPSVELRRWSWAQDVARSKAELQAELDDSRIVACRDDASKVARTEDLSRRGVNAAA
jgi:NAD(P)-dependent dehydrogenase (short-subunit alcohol dehydrogenase family)